MLIINYSKKAEPFIDSDKVLKSLSLWLMDICKNTPIKNNYVLNNYTISIERQNSKIDFTIKQTESISEMFSGRIVLTNWQLRNRKAVVDKGIQNLLLNLKDKDNLKIYRMDLWLKQNKQKLPQFLTIADIELYFAFNNECNCKIIVVNFVKNWVKRTDCINSFNQEEKKVLNTINFSLKSATA